MKNNSKTSLFLMELIIVILFFSIAAVVCVQLFVNAYLTNLSTKESSQATLITQNLAEGYYGCDGDLNAMTKLYAASVTGGVLTLYFDDEWTNVSDESSASYIATLTPDGASDASAGGVMLNADILVSNTSGEEILSQSISHYLPYRLEDVK